MLLNTYRFGLPPLPATVIWTPANLDILPAFWINDDSPRAESGSAVIRIDSHTRTLIAENPSSATAPTLVAAGLNGRSTLAFSGSQYLVPELNARNIPRSIRAMWFMAVYKLTPGDVSPKERTIIGFSGDGSSSFRAGLLAAPTVGANLPTVGGRRLDSDGFSGAISSTPRADEWVMVLGVMDFDGRVNSLFVNGDIDTVEGGAWSSGGKVDDSFPDYSSIGANPAFSTFFRGEIAEIVVGQGYLSEASVGKLFGYSASRWGLRDLLPAAHPYKTSAPFHVEPVRAGFAALYHENDVLYIGHRGTCYLYPEHTDIAYSNSFADGEPVLEQDVYITADGSPVAVHDSTATYTTTSSASFSSLTDAQVSALTVDSQNWHGSYFTGAITPLYSDVVSNYAGSVVLFSDIKVPTAVTPAVALADASAVNKENIVFSTYLEPSSVLAPAIAAGYPTMLGSNVNITEDALAAGNTYVGYQFNTNRSYFQDAIAEGLGLICFTINRRVDTIDPIKCGVRGIFSDDPAYLRATGPMATQSDFSNWMHGMVAGNDSGSRPSLADRGRLIGGDGWGWVETTDNHAGCLQGWACPIKDDNFANDFSIDFKLTFNSTPSSSARWAACFIADGADLDRPFPFFSGASSPAISGYLFLIRKNGTLNIYRRSVQTDTLIASQMGSTITTGAEVQVRIVVTATTVAVQLLASGGTVLYQASVADSAFRGGYFHLGKYGVACRFREIVVS